MPPKKKKKKSKKQPKTGKGNSQNEGTIGDCKTTPRQGSSLAGAGIGRGGRGRGEDSPRAPGRSGYGSYTQSSGNSQASELNGTEHGEGSCYAASDQQSLHSGLGGRTGREEDGGNAGPSDQGNSDCNGSDRENDHDRGADTGTLDAGSGKDRGADTGTLDAGSGKDRGADTGKLDAGTGKDRGADAGPLDAGGGKYRVANTGLSYGGGGKDRGADAGPLNAGGCKDRGADTGYSDGGGGKDCGADTGSLDAGSGKDRGADTGSLNAGSGKDRGADTGKLDAGSGKDRGADTGKLDAGSGKDRGADTGPLDAGSGKDRGADTGSLNAGSGKNRGADTGKLDAGSGKDRGADTGPLDARSGKDRGADTGSLNAGSGKDRGADTGKFDAGSRKDRGADTGPLDAGSGKDRGADTGKLDAGSGKDRGADTGPSDAGSGKDHGADTELLDAGSGKNGGADNSHTNTSGQEKPQEIGSKAGQPSAANIRKICTPEHFRMVRDRVYWMFENLFYYEHVDQVVTVVEKLELSSLSGKHVEDIFRWIIGKVGVLDPWRDCEHCFYLIIILGNLELPSWLFKNFKDQRSLFIAVDYLLYGVCTCSTRPMYISFSKSPFLMRIATILLRNCLHGGWLPLAAYLYPYFGQDPIVEAIAEVPINTYKQNDFLWYADILLSHLPPTGSLPSDEPIYQQLIVALMKSAPNNHCRKAVIEKYEKTFYAFFKSKGKALWSDLEQRLRAKKSRAKKLSELIKLSDQEMCNFSNDIEKALAEFVKSSNNMNQNEDLDHFIQLMSKQQFRTEKVFDILKMCAAICQPLLMELLNKEEFQGNWEMVALHDKLTVFTRFIQNKIEKVKEAKAERKVAEAYQMIETIVTCALIERDAELVKKLGESVFQKIIKKEGADSFLRACEDVAKLSLVVQQIYMSHIKNVLEKNECLLKHPPEILKKWPHSSFGQNLLSCALDFLNIPNKSYEQKKYFQNMMEWCEIWIILLRTDGCLDKHANFAAGRDAWHDLVSQITEGQISAICLDEIKKNEEHLSLLYALCQPRGSSDEKQTMKQKFKDCVAGLRQKRDGLSREVELLEIVIKYVKKDLQEHCGVNGVIEEFTSRQKKWRKTNLSELGDKFWGPLLPLLNLGSHLQPLMESVSFKQHMRQTSHVDSVDHDVGFFDEDEEEPNDVCSFIGSRIRKGIERFQAAWNDVFSDPNSLTLGKMELLLGNEVKDRKELEKEFLILEEYFKSNLPRNAKDYITDYVTYPSVLQQANAVAGVLGIFECVCVTDFELVFPDDDTATVLEEFADQFKTRENIDVQSLHEAMNRVEMVLQQCIKDPEDVEMVLELSKSRSLCAFVERTLEEDIRFLIDAVEEHSDHFISEAVVADLIDVHRFLAPLIRMCLPGSSQRVSLSSTMFLKKLVDSSTRNCTNITAKIHQCRMNINSLEGLYNSVANRGEVTKEIIASCLSKGSYTVSMDKDGVCEAKMSYAYENNPNSTPACYGLSELQDLRSRAHLIVSSADKHQQDPADSYGDTTPQSSINYTDFIERVNLLTEITTLLSQLRSSGYVKYREKHWRTLKSTGELQEMKDTLQAELQVWQEVLAIARKKYQFLNYYRSDQLCELYDFFTNRSQGNLEEVLSLIKFFDPSIEKQQLEKYQDGRSSEDVSNCSPERILSTVGATLEKIFANKTPAVRPVVGDGKYLTSMLECRVKPGELYIASLEEESLLTGNVLVSLYHNTSNAFPEPHQIIFCDPQTTWEEIELALRRCLLCSKTSDQNGLFCIANVEQLANEIQFKMINAINETQYGSDDAESQNGYHLALICRGGDSHHIVEEFSQYSHRISGMSDQALSSRLQSTWPDVKIVTSCLPGLGKTERIRREVLQKKMNVVRFSISGPLNPGVLVQRLKQLKLMDYHCLHLDLGEVDDPHWLDTFLFQLIITGMVCSGTKFYHLPTKNVYIEVANTLNERLLDSLVTVKFFTRIDLKRLSYDDLVVSSDITNNLQVVCQYLNLYDRGLLDGIDVHFTGSQKVKALPATQCKSLLAKYYSTNADVTFAAINTFLGVLANQLLKFSRSAFFKVANLKSMLEEDAGGVRKNLFEALLEVSKEFASRSIKSFPPVNAFIPGHCQTSNDHPFASSVSAKDMVERVMGMIQWEQSNHLLVVFQAADTQSIAAVYRDRSLVPTNVKNLLKSQKVGEHQQLEDFKAMGQDELRKKLVQIACAKPPERDKSGYALTPDNILKMILIILRVRAKVPVVIMGETGCGKTSLVRYLASDICQIKFFTFNLHAGITEEGIRNFIEDMNAQAKAMRKSKSREQIWVFLDEINTCDHLGLINSVMCHHNLLGQPLSRNLVFIAACNPYKLRPVENMKTAGLEGKDTTDEYSQLVYRVHPLPEALTDYVWDYGSLAEKDEMAYIERMVETQQPRYKKLLAKLLKESQVFIREAERNHYSVSLRDVRRCIRLIEWFIKMDKNRGERPEVPKSLQLCADLSKEFAKYPEIRGIVLALAHSYQSRLGTAELRKEYRRRMIKLFAEEGVRMKSEGDIDTFTAIVRMEEEDYLDRMELPPGTAKNTALRENVFVILVSILNRIPVFVVGKPGCSKSLSVQLIRSNLRGRDSHDPLFQALPQLYVVSFQGSESSTSDGIVKVFEKARKYKQDDDKAVLPVVLLDEVGLAENSRYNPLKVLHNLLEPGDGELPDVAVVGISNWALDAAKMNRATHLSRPEPTKQDLYETGQSLLNETRSSLDDKDLRGLADGYFEYQAKQKHENFHGLRDYYSLIKSLSQWDNNDSQQINTSLQRNFGGLPGELANIQKIFFDKLTDTIVSGEDVIPIRELIEKNLKDLRARHLMLITSGDSAVEILEQSLSQTGREVITIFGSRFEEDLSDDYNYRILSRIILCMERNCILILRDLERIYGSLYDMLNQNYAVVGKRKNCRVALGAFSNPMCHVNDGFRCIVLVDQNKVDYSDPPFLNRFEKQMLRFSDVLRENQKKCIEELDDWVTEISTVQGLESHFQESDMFVGFYEDTLPSLVLLHNEDTDKPSKYVTDKCKDDLMWTATPDGVLRAQKCDLWKRDPEEVNTLSEKYFEKPIHDGLVSFMKAVVEEDRFGDELGSKTIVMTYSTIHADIASCLEDDFQCQVERLGAYKSEKQLSEKITYFWSGSDKDLLILQCKPELDGAYMLLARSIIQEKRSVYKKAYLQQTNGDGKQKHVCIVVHLQRGRKEVAESWQFSFVCGWKQVFLDVLDKPAVSLNSIHTETIPSLLTSQIWPLAKIAQNCLLWCMSCMKYTANQRQLESVLHIARNLFKSDEVYQVIEEIVLDWVEACEDEGRTEEEGVSWQVKVACDREVLINSSTLLSAMEAHVSRIVRRPLAKIVYFLEKENAWPPHLSHTFTKDEDDEEHEAMWCSLIKEEAFFDMIKIPEALGADSYMLDGASLDLQIPFIQVVMKRVDALKDLILDEYNQAKENKANVNENGHLKPDVHIDELKRYSTIIADKVPEIEEYTPYCRSLYMDDLFDVVSAAFRESMSRHERISFVKCAFLSYLRENTLPTNDVLVFCTQLHLFVWLSKERVLDQLRLIDCCRGFMPSPVLEDLKTRFLSSRTYEQYFQDEDSESSASESSTSESSASDSSANDTDHEKEDNEHESRENEADSWTEHVKQHEGTPSHIAREMLAEVVNENEFIREQVYSELEDHGGDNEHAESEDDERAVSEDERAESEDERAESKDERAESEDERAVSEDERAESEDERAENKNERAESEDERAESEDERAESEDERAESEEHEELEDEEEDEEEQENFEDVLVTTLCEAMLPSQETVEDQNGGVEAWVRNSSILLPLAHKIDHQNPALHFLRLCVDFASLSFVPSSPAQQHYFALYILNEIAEIVQPEYLDNEEAFKRITKDLIKPLEDQIKDEDEKREALQRFSALFYGRCLDTNVDTSKAYFIVEQVVSSDSADSVVIMSPVILRLLMAEESEHPGIFINIVTNRSLIENCPCLKNINSVFQNLFGKNEIHHDSYGSAMLCDLIQSQLKLDERYSIEDLDSSNCELLRIVRAAIDTLCGDDEENCGLVLISSVALLKAFFTMLSNFISEAISVTKADSAYTHALGEISCLLTDTDNSSRRCSLRVYFVKQLYQTHDMNMFKLRKLCLESERLPAIKELIVDNSRIPKAEWHPSPECVEYNRVREAYLKLLNEEDGQDMLGCIKECEQSLTRRHALMHMLVNMIYLKRAEQKLTEREEYVVSWLREMSEHFPLPLREMLLRIIGRQDFDHPQMQLSSESSADDVEIALLILHVTSAFASELDTRISPFSQYVSNLEKCDKSYILANGYSELPHRDFESPECANCSSPFTCSCGLRVAFKHADAVGNMCPSCNVVTASDANQEKSESTAHLTKGYLLQTPTTMQTNVTKCGDNTEMSCTKEMNPTVYRAMHLIVHACLFSGVAMGISTRPKLSSLLKNGTVGARTGKDPEEFCLTHVKADLKCLAAILNCKREIVFKVMHIVVDRCTALVSTLNRNLCFTPEERLEWEQKFSEAVKDVFPLALGSTTKLKEMTRERLKDGIEERAKEDSSVTEDLLLELDDYPDEPALQNKQLKRVFRVTRLPSFQDFRATFVNAPEDLREKHCFLSLFFTTSHQLSLVGNLYHLLEWTRHVSSALTHCISRKDAKSYTIDEFIDGYLLKEGNKSEEDVKNEKKLFNKFKQAWNNVVELVNQELCPTTKCMPRLTEADAIGYCITESESGLYLRTAIKILVSLQNSILDDIISLSAKTRNAALSFLERTNNCSSMSSISIQEASEKDVIDFCWSDDIFRYAHSNPNYGKGEEIDYDFQQMEVMLSREVAQSKCYLSGSLNKFIFAKELFHSSGTMLADIRQLIPQSATLLPENVRQGLARMKDRRIHDAQKLLQHIESLMFLLKLKSTDAVRTYQDIPFEEFIEKWASRLPSAFPVSLLPEPKKSIRLVHVAALYEALEDMLADGAIEGLSIQFRQALTHEAKEHLNRLVNSKDGPIKLQIFITALRRFVFRYLSSEKLLPEPNTLLDVCLKEESLWWPSKPPKQDLISKEITLEYTYFVVIYLQDLSKERKGGKAVKGARLTSRTRLSKKGGRRSTNF